jgi:hypothetical protein
VLQHSDIIPLSVKALWTYRAVSRKEVNSTAAPASRKSLTSSIWVASFESSLICSRAFNSREIARINCSLPLSSSHDQSPALLSSSEISDSNASINAAESRSPYYHPPQCFPQSKEA